MGRLAGKGQLLLSGSTYLDDDLPAAAAEAEASAIMATGVSVAERLCRLWATAAAVTGTLPVRSTLSVDDIDRFGDRERGFDISCKGKEGRKEEAVRICGRRKYSLKYII